MLRDRASDRRPLGFDTGECVGKVTAKDHHVNRQNEQQQVQRDAEQKSNLHRFLNVPRSNQMHRDRQQQSDHGHRDRVGPRVVQPTGIVKSQSRHDQVEHQPRQGGQQQIERPHSLSIRIRWRRYPRGWRHFPRRSHH